MANVQDLAIRILVKRDAVDKDLNKVRASFDKAWGRIKVGAAVAGAAAGAALTSGLLSAFDAAAARAKLGASLGDPEFAKRAGSIAGKLYADGWGASTADVIAATGAVASSIEGMQHATDAALTEATKDALAFAKTFDVDVAEATRNAGILLKTGLAKDADEAFDLMVRSMQKVPAALRGEVMDATQEYSQFFAQLGFTGAEALGLIGDAAAAAGQYGIDKMGDSIKEFTIRATDMSALTQTAFAMIGLDAQTMANELLAGGDAAQTAFQQIVSGLRDIEDPATQSNTAIALFGTQLEDLGTGNIPDFLASLDPMESKLTDVTGAADEMADTIAEGANPLETLKRQIQTALVEKLSEAVPYIQGAARWLKENKAVIGPLVAVLGTFALVIGTIIAVTKIWAMVQAALNVVMMMNPIGLIVLAVLALIAVGVMLWQNWDTVKEKLGAAWDAVKGFFSAGVDKVKEWFGGLVDFFKGIPDKIKEGLRKVGDFLSAPFKAGLDKIKQFWNSTIGGKGFDIPSWVPGVGGKSFRFPKFHQGGVVPGTGDQVIVARGGEGVFTREQMRAMGSGGGPQRVVVELDVTGADSEMAAAIRNMIRVRGAKTFGLQPAS